MASYEIYCPCKVNEIGVGTVDGPLMPYLLEPWIHAGNPRANCKFCGELLRIVGCKCPQCSRPVPADPAGETTKGRR